MPKNQLASLLVMLVWIAAFTPIGSSVYNPTESDVEELGGEKPNLDDPPQPDSEPPKGNDGEPAVGHGAQPVPD